MEDDDGYGDMYTDVLRPLQPQPQPQQMDSRPSSLGRPIDSKVDSDDEEILYGASESKTSVVGLNPELNSEKRTFPHGAVDRGGSNLQDFGGFKKRGEEKLLDKKSGVYNLLGKDDLEIAVDGENEEEGKSRIVERIGASENWMDQGVARHFDQEPVIPGLLRKLENHGDSYFEDDLESDKSEEDLKIVFNDNGDEISGIERMKGLNGEDDDKGGPLDTVAGNGDLVHHLNHEPMVNEQEWKGDDGGAGVDEEEKVLGYAARSDGEGAVVPALVAPKIGLDHHMYHHPLHSEVKINMMVESPGYSSSDDFAALLDEELGSSEDDDDFNMNHKRRKLEETTDQSPATDICPHPGFYAGMCMRCGQKNDDETGIQFGYIDKNLRLANDEITRLRDKDLKSLLQRKKLSLVLDLDHTLLNSTRLADLTVEEHYLNCQSNDFPDSLKTTLFRLGHIQMMTKLRPFVRTFLMEASKRFEMYIYTMGERPYALEMAKLLDPEDIYFNSKIIAQGDCTQKHQKGLDVVLGQESSVLILDDTEGVWGKHKENLILMERYLYFASSCKQFGFKCKSPSQLGTDESETEGALSTVLATLEKVHSLFFDVPNNDELEAQDVRRVLKMVRKSILNGCKIIFSRVFPSHFPAKNHHLWIMAEQLGATCTTKIDPTVSHVVAMDPSTDKSRWALKENKHLVHPSWLEAANYMWKKVPEENFRVEAPKAK